MKRGREVATMIITNNNSQIIGECTCQSKISTPNNFEEMLKISLTWIYFACKIIYLTNDKTLCSLSLRLISIFVA